MSLSRLEQLRGLREDVERLQHACVELLLQPLQTYRGKLKRDHQVAFLLDRISMKTLHIKAFFDAGTPEATQLATEISSVSSMPHAEWPQRLAVSLADIQNSVPEEPLLPQELLEDHRKPPSLIPVDVQSDLRYVSLPPFSSEERLGRVFDLHSLYAQARQDDLYESDYYSFIQAFFELPQAGTRWKTTAAKQLPKLVALFRALVDYVKDFLARSRPLQRVSVSEVSLEEGKKCVIAELLREAGLPEETTLDGLRDQIHSSDQVLQSLTAEQLKAILAAHGLKQGGTPEQRASRLWSVVALPSGAAVPAELRATSNDMDLRIHALILERLLFAYSRTVADIVHATRAHTERKLLRLSGEFEREAAEEDEEDKDEDGDADRDKDRDQDVIYNPKNVPLGPDGKPIPYWLYKLHGLNIEYRCQICGGYSYWGPRAFEKHFTEWRHARAMKSLGIPNTRQFHHITKIADAQALFEKIREQSRDDVVMQPETE
eukprot:ANDGO_00486.mRNA.1 Splicing factor SF3a60 homolog